MGEHSLGISCPNIRCSKQACLHRAMRQQIYNGAGVTESMKPQASPSRVGQNILVVRIQTDLLLSLASLSILSSNCLAKEHKSKIYTQFNIYSSFSLEVHRAEVRKPVLVRTVRT